MVEWLPAALTLEARGVSRRQIAVQLGKPFGTVNRALWEHHNPAKAVRPPRTLATGRKSMSKGLRKLDSRWTDEALTERWASRKARRVQERARG